MDKNIMVSNPEGLEKKERRIFEEGIDNFHVLADFDRTLTRAFAGGKKVPSIISVLRDYDYLDEDYSKKSKALAEHYGKIEMDNSINDKEKKKAMNKWWTKHFDLLIEKKLNKKHLEKVVNDDNIKFREEVPEFLDFLKKKNIPLVIMSSSGLGDAIPMYLKKKNVFYNNIHIVTNSYEWDSDDNAIRVKQPIIHSMNKDEASIKELPVYNELLKRKNVLLLGDSLGDLGMIKGFQYENLVSVGFLNEKIEESLDKYKKNFDVVITNDGNFSYVNNFLKKFD